LAWRTMYVAYKARYDQSGFEVINVGPASEVAPDHEGLQAFGMLAATVYCYKAAQPVTGRCVV
jgi:hypothetical protein